MGIHKELLAFCALEITMRHMEDHIMEAEKAVPQQMTAVLDGVREIICDNDTTDFEKVDKIIKLFVRNGISSGACHDL